MTKSVNVPAMRRTLAALSLLLLLAGCSSTATEAAPTPSASATEDEGPVEYSTVEELMEAYVDAGGACQVWEQTNQVTDAAESGTCGDSAVLATFTSETQRDGVVANIKEIASQLDHEATVLVGPNWIINSSLASYVATRLGGTLVTT